MPKNGLGAGHGKQWTETEGVAVRTQSQDGGNLMAVFYPQMVR